MDASLPVKMIDIILMHFSEADSTFQQRRHLSFALQGHHSELPIWQFGIYLVSGRGILLKERLRRPMMQK